MASQTFSATSTSNLTQYGGDTAWTFSNNAGYGQADVSRAGSTAITMATIQTSSYGFSIPVGSTINGISVRINYSVVSGTGGFGAYQDYFANAQITNSTLGNSTSRTSDLPRNTATAGVYTDLTLGSSSDLWSQSLTPAMVNSSSFGFILSARTTLNNLSASVRAFEITVTYTAPTATPTLGVYHRIDTILRAQPDPTIYNFVFPGGWGAGYAGAQYGGLGDVPFPVVTFNRAHTFDTILKKQNTKTNTFDTVLKKRILKTHTFDTFLKKRYTRAHTFDAFLKKRYVKTHTFDTILKKSYIKTHTFDTFLKKSMIKSHMFDTTLRAAGINRMHTFDTFLRKTVSKSHTFDASLSRRLTRSHTFDTVLKRSSTRSHTFDTFLKKRFVKTHTFDTFLRKRYTKTHTFDTILKKRFTKTNTFDTVLKRRATKVHTFDTTLRKAVTRSHTFDTILRKTTVRSHTFDYMLTRRGIKMHTFDTFLKKRTTRQHTFDFAVKLPVFRTHTFDTILKAVDYNNVPRTGVDINRPVTYVRDKESRAMVIKDRPTTTAPNVKPRTGVIITTPKQSIQ